MYILMSEPNCPIVDGDALPKHSGLVKVKTTTGFSIDVPWFFQKPILNNPPEGLEVVEVQDFLNHPLVLNGDVCTLDNRKLFSESMTQTTPTNNIALTLDDVDMLDEALSEYQDTTEASDNFYKRVGELSNRINGLRDNLLFIGEG